MPDETPPHPLEHRVASLEAGIARLLVLAESMAGAVLGSQDGTRAGHAEQIRQLDARTSRLERIVGWLGAIGTTVLAGLGTAWASANVHIGQTPPPPGHP